MNASKISQIRNLGQSIWLDFFDREIMDSGKLQRLIDVDGLRGITSNPSIFEKAISSGSDYDEEVTALAKKEESDESIFFELAIKDIQRAADLFLPVYEQTQGEDGFISLEVSPFLAHDAEGSVQQADHLWNRVDRRNVMIKIPGTKEGIEAIRRCVASGININITLLFGLQRYIDVTEAYISGLEERVDAKKPVDPIRSVASFFLSRIDTMVDPILVQKGLNDLKGQVAIASAKRAYQRYKEIFNSRRFRNLQQKGANKQRVLWASTSTKDPTFSNVKYVEALIGAETVNTLPLPTIDAFNDHGKVENHLEDGLQNANDVFSRLEQEGININWVTQQLEDEGVDKFCKAYTNLLKAINIKKNAPF